MDRFLASFGLTPSSLFAILVVVAVFATVMALAMPVLAGDRLRGRMRAVALERDQMRALSRARLAIEKDARRKSLRQENKEGIAAVVVQRLNLRSALADDKTVASLRIAGYRGERPLTLLLFARAVLPLLFFLVALFYIFGLGFMADYGFMPRLLACLLLAYAGFYAPVLFVNNKASKRKASITRAWPDALDLLLICVESGTSIEAAFRRVADEIGIQSIPLAEELVLLTAELSYLPDRRAAYENLVARTGLDAVRATATALIQAEKYGTPLGTALRTLSQENRDTRMNMAEKKAAALPPKLTVPMIIFFLPVLFAVILGPAIIQVMAIYRG